MITKMKKYLIVFILTFSSDALGNDISNAENWLKNLTTMEADFIQVSSDGRSVEGKLYLKRGKGFRFEYSEPSPLLIIGRGNWVIVQNTQEKTSDNYPISQTPLSQFLSDNISLQPRGYLTTSKNSNGILSIYIVSKEKNDGSLTLDFSIKPFQLRRWKIVDQVGTEIIITLQNHAFGMDLPDKTFRGIAIDQ